MSAASQQLALDLGKQKSQLDRVRLVMLDHQWHTLEDLEARCGGTVASCSARVRDLRKVKHGGHAVERKRVGSAQWYQYRIAIKAEE